MKRRVYAVKHGIIISYIMITDYLYHSYKIKQHVEFVKIN